MFPLNSGDAKLSQLSERVSVKLFDYPAGGTVRCKMAWMQQLHDGRWLVEDTDEPLFAWGVAEESGRAIAEVKRQLGRLPDEDRYS